MTSASQESEKPQVLVGPGPKQAAARRRRLGERRLGERRTPGGVAGPVTEPAAPCQATEELTVDVTGSIRLVSRLEHDRAWLGLEVTLVAVAARALVLAVRSFPEIDASRDDELDLRSLLGSAGLLEGAVPLTGRGAPSGETGLELLRPGESALLTVGDVHRRPWVVEGEVRAREVAVLALRFDSPLVDAELGSRVLARTGDILSEPAHALIFG